MITTTSEITVRLIQSMGGDHIPIAAAKTSTSGEEALEYARPGSEIDLPRFIDFLTKRKHGSPTEHSAMTFFIHAPAFVWWEWIRHRVGQNISCPGLSDDTPDASFNLESGRYKQLEPVFWVPRRNRKMIPVEGFRPSSPKFMTATDRQYETMLAAMEYGYRAAWTSYRCMIEAGIANEVARSVLGFGVYYSGWVTTNPRGLMSFLSLRTHDPNAMFVSFPQAEIEEAARACEAVLAAGWPKVYAAYVKNRRVAP